MSFTLPLKWLAPGAVALMAASATAVLYYARSRGSAARLEAAPTAETKPALPEVAELHIVPEASAPLPDAAVPASGAPQAGKEEVFESFDDDELDTTSAAPVRPGNLLQNLASILENQHKVVESDPGAIHPACVGFDFMGYEEAPFDPAACTPVMLGAWKSRFSDDPAHHVTSAARSATKRPLASPALNPTKRDRVDLDSPSSRALFDPPHIKGASPTKTVSAAAPASQAASPVKSAQPMDVSSPSQALSPAAMSPPASNPANPPAKSLASNPASPASPARSAAASSNTSPVKDPSTPAGKLSSAQSISSLASTKSQKTFSASLLGSLKRKKKTSTEFV